MCWRKAVPILLLAGNALAAEGWVVGVGGEADTADGLAGTVIVDVGVGENTWLTGSIGGSRVERPFRGSIDTLFGDLGVDHWFDPVGVRFGAAYWGDSDILDSRDWRGSLYWRSERFSLAGDYEYRDLNFVLPATNQFPGRTIEFDANGIGLTTRFELTDAASISVTGMTYDYSVNLRLDNNRGLLDLLSFSRLSLINSLVDHRAFVVLGLEAGENSWQFEAGTWRGAVDGSTSQSATVRFLTPVGDRSDIEFGLGVDNSELYGTVTFFSAFLYFYGD